MTISIKTQKLVNKHDNFDENTEKHSSIQTRLKF